ncbi:channel-forming protein ArfA/OmpATb [Mycolicibacterium arenosum]|uniref:OmpA family protein n=1 Tax=Mycolicibacterium arenosum TaxID=2952157 RepID=A0ABT1M198_9MYCO|nr:OmpA family protein [Mycolicibacterium sp. CAU 1645]MCP9271617.1 OmpA family protein [Mycolicibacterium sp. CAU 1645]
MAGSDRRAESRFYRRMPGPGWLFAFLAVPLLLALIGWAGLGRTGTTSDALTLPTVNPTATMSETASAPTPPSSTAAAPRGDYPAWSIVRSGNGFTLTGEVADEETKRGLIDTLKLVLPGASIVDELKVTPGVRTPDIGGLGGLFSAAVGIPDFSLKLDGGTATLTGVAPAQPIKDSADTYAKAAFPDVNVVNDIEVSAASPSASAPPPSATTTQARPPAPAPGGACASLQADITGLLKTPITFVTNGATLAAESQRLVGQIADKVKGCPDAKLSVTGHTDGTGNDAINTPLSAGRAKAVADALVADGVPAGNVTSRGVGASAPIAPDDTAEGRAQNRRVEITVN